MIKKHGKDLLIFASGIVTGTMIGSVYVVFKVIKSDELRNVLVKKLSDKAIKFVYGEELSRNRSKYTSYNKYAGFNARDIIIFYTRTDAEKVLQELRQLRNLYGFVTISDLCELSGAGYGPRDNEFGWYTLNGVNVKRIDHHYAIDLPNPVRIY